MQKTELKNLHLSMRYLWNTKRQNSHRITWRWRKDKSLWQRALIWIFLFLIKTVSVKIFLIKIFISENHAWIYWSQDVTFIGFSSYQNSYHRTKLRIKKCHHFLFNCIAESVRMHLIILLEYVFVRKAYTRDLSQKSAKNC